MGQSLAEQYEANFNALAATTKGAAPQSQLMFAAVLLTGFERLEALLTNKSLVGRALINSSPIDGQPEN